MRSVNKVILVGNLTRDPELKNTSSGQSIVTFGLATNRQWVTSNGERKDSAEFHECVAWAKLADICSKYLKKGMLVYVEGYLKTRSWDMEDGTRRFRTEVVLQDMIMLEKRGDDGEYTEVETPEDTSSTEEAAPAEEKPAEEAAPAEEKAEETPAEEAAEKPAEEPEKAAEAPAKEEPAAETPAPGTLSADIEDDNMF